MTATGTQVHNKAKMAALRDLAVNHRGAFTVLRSGWADHIRRESPELSTKSVHDRARSRAQTDLVDLHRDEYAQLRQQWADHFRAVLS